MARSIPTTDGPVRVYPETGATWVFALALDWPGWCRRARTPDAVLETLEAHRVRYGDARSD